MTPNICYVESSQSIAFNPYVKNIFPMYLYLTKVNNKTYRLEPTQETIDLCDYILENAVFDGIISWDVQLPEGKLYIDDVNVTWLTANKGLTYIHQWNPTKKYFDNFNTHYIYLDGINKGLIEVIYDD